jgi:hypothetical protein
MPNEDSAIKARFWVTKSAVTVYAIYKDVHLTLRWKRGAESDRHVKTLIANLPEMVKDALNEIFVQDQVARIEWEIEELFLDEDNERPDDN